MQKLKKLWSDPVIASVLASAIFSGVSWAYDSISMGRMIGIYEYMAKSVNVPVVFLMVPWVFVIVFLFFKVKNNLAWKTKITNEGDILVVLNEWWPKAKGFQSDVTIDFEQVERECNIQQQLVKKYIDQVAQQQGFSRKIQGEKFSTFTYSRPSSSFTF